MSVTSDLVSKLPRRARWAVPVAAAAAVALAVAGSSLAGAQGAPRLPARTTAQLLAAVNAPTAAPSAMQGVVQETANLGLPNLPGSSASDPLSGLSLLSGSHTIKIWYDGPARVRIAIPVPLGEADLRRDGGNAWLWDSKTNRATHYVLPAGAGEPSVPAAAAPEAVTPQQLARQILAAVGRTTTVGTQSNVTVAGQAAYQLSLAPKDHRSLIGQVRIAIDARNSLPLRVQVYARGASAPAFEVAYTSLSFTRPAASNFAFTPPPGATVKTVTVPGGPPCPSGRRIAARPGPARTPPLTRNLGRGWLSVLVLPVAGVMPGGLTQGDVAIGSGTPAGSSGSSQSTVTFSSGAASGGGPGIETSGPGLAMLGAARPVHGSWGSGRLLKTSLISVLFTDGGQVLIGAVQPSVLYADAARLPAQYP